MPGQGAGLRRGMSPLRRSAVGARAPRRCMRNKNWPHAPPAAPSIMKAKHLRRISKLTEYIHQVNTEHWDQYDVAAHKLPLDTWTYAVIAFHKVDGITAPFELVLDMDLPGDTNAAYLAAAVDDMRREGHVGMFLAFEQGMFLHRTFILLTDHQIVHVDSNGAACDLKSADMCAAFRRMSATPLTTWIGRGLQQTCRSDSCLLLSTFVWVQIALDWQRHGREVAIQRLQYIYRREHHPTVLRQVWVWCERLVLELTADLMMPAL